MDYMEKGSLAIPSNKRKRGKGGGKAEEGVQNLEGFPVGDEAMAEQNKLLRKQLENSKYELQLQRNELTNAQAAQKLMLVKEQQRDCRRSRKRNTTSRGPTTYRKQLIVAPSRRVKMQDLESKASDINEELTCIICKDLFVEAITCTCGHTFCSWCINNCHNC